METQDSGTAGLVRLIPIFPFKKVLKVIILHPPVDMKRLICTSSLIPGGEVTFNLKNDGPTLTGARATFAINLNFPPNQTVLSDGEVVWTQNCTINGKIISPLRSTDTRISYATCCDVIISKIFLNAKIFLSFQDNSIRRVRPCILARTLTRMEFSLMAHRSPRARKKSHAMFLCGRLGVKTP